MEPLRRIPHRQETKDIIIEQARPPWRNRLAYLVPAKVLEKGMNAFTVRSAAIVTAVFLAGGGVACSTDKSEQGGPIKTNSYRAGFQEGAHRAGMKKVLRELRTESEMREFCVKSASYSQKHGEEELYGDVFVIKPGEVNVDEYVDGCLAGLRG